MSEETAFNSVTVPCVHCRKSETKIVGRDPLVIVRDAKGNAWLEFECCQKDRMSRTAFLPEPFIEMLREEAKVPERIPVVPSVQVPSAPSFSYDDLIDFHALLEGSDDIISLVPDPRPEELSMVPDEDDVTEFYWGE